jgi:hypothetical protein
MNYQGPGRARGTISVAALILAACQFDPHVRSYSRTRPAAEELVGTWVATPDTLKTLAAANTSSRPKIQLFADGRIRVVDVPAFSDESRLTTIEDVDARWRLSQSEKGWWGLSLDRSTWFCSDCLVILNDASPRLLVIRYGDPDSGLGLEFERVAETAPGRGNRDATAAAPGAKSGNLMVAALNVGPQPARVVLQAVLDATDGEPTLAVCDTLLDRPLHIAAAGEKAFAVHMAMVVTQLGASMTVDGVSWTAFCPNADGPGLLFRKGKPPAPVVVPKVPPGPK